MSLIHGNSRSTAQSATQLTFVSDPHPVGSTARRQVQSERVRVVMMEGTMVEFGLAALFAASAIWVLWPIAEPARLIAWLACLALPLMARLLLQARYTRTAVDIRDSSQTYWARRLIACFFASGLAWASLVMLVPATDMMEYTLLLGLHAAYITLLANALSVYLPAVLGFALPSTLAFTGASLASEYTGTLSKALVLSVMVCLVSWLCAARQSRATKTMLTQRYEEQEVALKMADERDRAELAMLAKNRFLAAASHDLRQPLHAIGLYASCLRTRFESQDSSGVLNRLQRSIAALSTLFDGILDVSRLDADAIDNAPSAVALDPLLQRLSHEYGMQARAKGLKLHIDTHTGLVAHVDPMLLERVLLNLIGNAIKFTDTGEVSVSVEQIDGAVTLNVSDTGCGISEADCEHVFSEYHQLERPGSQSSGGGLGLGLAIVRRLCLLMSGSIEVSSAEGAGSMFTVSLPQQATSADAESDRLIEGRTSAGRTSLWCKHALVVDNDQAVLDGTRRTLAQMGCRAITACTVDEAIRRSEALPAHSPDVLIVDVGLKGSESGLEALRTIRAALGASIPALLTTGDSGCRYVSGTPTTRVRLLHKPYASHRLRAELHKLAQVHRRRAPAKTPTVRPER